MSPAGREEVRPGQQRIWLILGDKLGDNAQANALAQRIAQQLPATCEQKQLVFYRPFRKGKPPFVPSLYHVNNSASAPLSAPWPHLVVTVGRRPAMAALWVKRRAARAGVVVRVVLMGPPKGYAKDFDLILLAEQYRLRRPLPNVMPLGLPPIAIDDGCIAAARAQWQTALAPLARPLTAVLVGGATQPFRLDAEVAADLLRTAHDLAQDGACYFCTSRRTAPTVVATLRAGLRPGDRLFDWHTPGAPDNPYLGLAAHAGQFIVTGDSVSMLVEIARLGRRLSIYELPLRGTAPRADRIRDLTRIHAHLYERGLALRANGASAADANWRAATNVESATVALDQQLAPAVARIAALLAGAPLTT